MINDITQAYKKETPSCKSWRFFFVLFILFFVHAAYAGLLSIASFDVFVPARTNQHI